MSLVKTQKGDEKKEGGKCTFRVSQKRLLVEMED